MNDWIEKEPNMGWPVGDFEYAFKHEGIWKRSIVPEKDYESGYRVRFREVKPKRTLEDINPYNIHPPYGIDSHVFRDVWSRGFRAGRNPEFNDIEVE